MKILYLIPARGGSKGIPGKNIKILGNKPLIHYSIEVARKLAKDEDICVSTDDPEIIKAVEKTGLNIPFIRPAELATDSVGTQDVILHALDFYLKKGIKYSQVVLLQPTSPFRKSTEVSEAINLYTSDIDMVVSVVESTSNPYFTLVEEDENGYLHKSKKGNFARRQDCPKVYEYNGAIYVINVKSLQQSPMALFKKVIKYVMPSMNSVDLDTPLDWEFAEFLIKKGIL